MIKFLAGYKFKNYDDAGYEIIGAYDSFEQAEHAIEVDKKSTEKYYTDKMGWQDKYTYDVGEMKCHWYISEIEEMEEE